MGLLKGKVTLASSEVELVHSEDEDVDAGPLAGCGWVPAADVVSVRAGATRVKVRALNADENTRVRDVEARMAQASARKLAVELGLVAVHADGRWTTSHEAVRDLSDTLAVSGPLLLDLLGGYILNATRGIDQRLQYAIARRLYGTGGDYGEPKS